MMEMHPSKPTPRSRTGSQSGSVHKASSVSSLNQPNQSNQAATSQWVADQNAVSLVLLPSVCQSLSLLCIDDLILKLVLGCLFLMKELVDPRGCVPEFE